MERKAGETFEQLIGARWREEDFVEKIAEGYQKDLYEEYEKGVEALEAAEKEILRCQKADAGEAGTSGAGQV